MCQHSYLILVVDVLLLVGGVCRELPRPAPLLLLLLCLGLLLLRLVLLREADRLELEVEGRARVLLAPGGGRGAVVRVVRVQRPQAGSGVGEPVAVVVLGPGERKVRSC